jgi:hypothetical protein
MKGTLTVNRISVALAVAALNSVCVSGGDTEENGWFMTFDGGVNLMNNVKVEGESESISMLPFDVSSQVDRLREECCGDVTEEATTAGAPRGHGQEGPLISRIITEVSGYLRSDSSARISVIRGQKQSGSTMPPRPPEPSRLHCTACVVVTSIRSFSIEQISQRLA